MSSCQVKPTVGMLPPKGQHTLHPTLGISRHSEREGYPANRRTEGIPGAAPESLHDGVSSYRRQVQPNGLGLLFRTARECADPSFRRTADPWLRSELRPL